MNRGVVDEKSVLIFAVLAQRFSVIAGRHNQRRFIELVLLEPCDQLSKFMVGICDLTVVQMLSIFGTIRIRRIVWTVRIIEMQPKKKWAARSLLQPRERVRNTLSGPTIHQPNIFLLESFCRKRIVVEIETPCQAPTAVQYKRTHNRTGSVSSRLERLRYRSELRSEWLTGEILHSILKRICSRENHCMRGPCQRHL